MKSVSDLIGNEYLEWKPGTPYILSSQTGRGKTTFVMTRLLKNAAAQNKDVLYICNRKALYAQVDQIAADMTQSFKNSFSLTEEESRHLVIQTYQACETKMESPFRFSGKLYVIFDEAHYFLEDASFNSGTNLWSDWIREFYGKTINAGTPICVFMTATPEPLMCFLAMNNEKTSFGSDSLFCNIRKMFQRRSWLCDNIDFLKREFYMYDGSSDNKAKKNLCERVLNEYPEIGRYQRELRDLDIYRDGKAYIQTALDSKDGVQEIRDDLDYSYVEECYFRDFIEIVDNICKTDEKWLIFINDSVKGQQFAQELNTLGIETVFTNASLKNTSAVKEQLKQLETKQSFSCRVLISTSILDCGINVIDDAVRNIAIFNVEKTAFMQMLGRVRVRDNQKLRLYIKAYTAQEIRNRIQYTCKIIHIMYNFYMLHQNEYSGNGTTFHYKPVMRMDQRKKFLRELKGSNYNAISFKPKLMIGNNKVNPSVIDAWKEEKILSEYEINRNYLVHSLYVLYCFDQAKKYTHEGKIDDIYYLKYQLSWLGKKYDESRWVSYTRQRDEIATLLDEYLGNEDGMLSEEQDVFAEKVFELLCRMSVIPSTAKKNSSALKRTGHTPGKNILNKCFEEIGLPYIIASKSKMQNGKREQRWYVKRIDAETDE